MTMSLPATFSPYRMILSALRNVLSQRSNAVSDSPPVNRSFGVQGHAQGCEGSVQEVGGVATRVSRTGPSVVSPPGRSDRRAPRHQGEHRLRIRLPVLLAGIVSQRDEGGLREEH